MPSTRAPHAEERVSGRVSKHAPLRCNAAFRLPEFSAGVKVEVGSPNETPFQAAGLAVINPWKEVS
jgi:hypothetical protein